jgi:hypothetical protein
MRDSDETAPNDIKERKEIPWCEQAWLHRYFWPARFVSSVNKVVVSCVRIVISKMVEFGDFGSLLTIGFADIDEL